MRGERCGKKCFEGKIREKRCFKKAVEWHDWMICSAKVALYNVHFALGQSTESGEIEAECRSNCIS
jgi:hypothetical protein